MDFAAFFSTAHGISETKRTRTGANDLYIFPHYK
jgi:hypothetical protein